VISRQGGGFFGEDARARVESRMIGREVKHIACCVCPPVKLCQLSNMAHAPERCAADHRNGEFDIHGAMRAKSL